MPVNQPARIWVIIPAAGSGQRMAAAIPKQYLEINGKTILETTIELLLACEDVEKIVVTTALDDQRWSSLACTEDPRVIQTQGSSTRAQSVYNGLLELKPLASEVDWVLVHDAARPCLSMEMLGRFIQNLSDHPIGGILAVPARDTLKISHTTSNSETIDRTLDRTNVWLAQTPQMFRFSLLINAMEDALRSNFSITDEASAMEMAGHSPRLIEGESRNLKITTSDDLALAQFLLYGTMAE